jgi:Mg2+/Co2+ transporter CorB
LSDIPLGALIGALVFLVLLSAFFSAAEIAMVSLNRHRLRHLARVGHRGARLAQRLLARPDRLIGVILLGSNTINALFSALTTFTILQLTGDDENAIGIATGVIAMVVLILTDLAPKTLSALNPERIAWPSAYILTPLLKVAYPFVWFVNMIANGLLRLIGVSPQSRPQHDVSPEELRTIVMEAGVLIPETHQDMLLAILDLEKVTVDDVMIPRVKIDGIDLDAGWDDILARITASRHTRLPVYRSSLDTPLGILHLRRVLTLLREDRLDQESLQQMLVEPYFIPQGTSLHRQLHNFKQAGRRLGLVVDEYGDIQGLVTMDDILEEIVGDFGPRINGRSDDIHPQEDGSFLVRGTVHLRDLNRRLDWNLPTDESRTLNGLIVEYLEDIPEPGTSLMLNGYMVEIVRTRGTAVDVARIRPIATAGTTPAPAPTKR